MMRFELYRKRRLVGRPQWRWRLVAGNGRIIAHSGEGYINKADALSAIDLVQGSAGVRIVEV